jgi:purine-nucleoside phosphorylase
VEPFAAADAAAADLANRTGQDHHDVAVVLGSGWLPAADAFGHGGVDVPFTDLTGFPAPTVAGHVGQARSVGWAGHRVLLMLGRVHLYEGHPPSTVVHGVRMAVAAGCHTVVLTNAAGGINAGYRVAQPVLIRDHLNLTATSPLGGPMPADRPVRFVDLTDCYSPRLRQLARAEDPSLVEGVYAALPGPHYETPAEVNMLRGFGADLVGMSTALEAIAARHLGAEVLGLSLVTNVAAGLASDPVSHEDVIATGAAAARSLGDLIAAVVATLP